MRLPTGNVASTSDDLIVRLVATHFSDATTLFDPTGSYGVFYKKLTGIRVLRGDIRLEVDPDILASFEAIPLKDDAVDVCVFDPPYKRGSRKTGATSDYYSNRYGNAPNNENAATKQYYRAVPELFRVASQGVIIKLQDAADGHSFHDRRFLVSKFVEAHTGLRPHDVALVYRQSPPKTLTNGKRRFLRQQVSYFLVWKWRLGSRGQRAQFRY